MNVRRRSGRTGGLVDGSSSRSSGWRRARLSSVTLAAANEAAEAPNAEASPTVKLALEARSLEALRTTLPDLTVRLPACVKPAAGVMEPLPSRTSEVPAASDPASEPCAPDRLRATV